MLDFLKGKVSDRKLRMFAVACCYICRRGEVNERLAEDYESVVRFVDGTGTLEEVRNRWRPPTQGSNGGTWPERPFVWARDFASIASHPAEHEGRYEHFPSAAEATPLIHEIFGNPFRRVRFSPAWRTDTAVTLAKQMYATREFSAMPILADALQDAGCDNEDVLNHCRDGNATHVRGCWVVDLVLGKK
jgi:hypothetical protein